MTGETTGAQASDPGHAPLVAAAKPTVSSWLSGLIGPGKQGGRLKGATLKSLVWLGVVAVAGMGVMGLGDLIRPSRQTGNPGPAGAAATAGLTGQPGAGTATGAAGPLAAGSGSAAAASGSEAATAAQGVPINVSDLETMIERHLERILSQIQGAGKVTVAVSLQTGATYVYGYDETQTSQTTQERDATGGTRTVTETNSSKEAMVMTQDSTSQPVVVTVELPPLDGVVVVATGARDSQVKALIARAVQVLYGVPAHRVEVLPGG